MSPKLSKDHQPFLEVFRELGVRPEVRLTGGGHVRFSWVNLGVRRVVVVPSTPGGGRSVQNNCATIRREHQRGSR